MDKGGFKVDLSYLQDVVNCSDEFMIEMIDLFIAQTPVYFEELDQFINESNWSRVAEIAHKINIGIIVARILDDDVVDDKL